MKRLLIIFLLFSGAASAQTVGQFRYDTTKFLKVGGFNEVKIQNKTMDSLGIFTNVGGGLGQWIRPKSVAGGIKIGNDTILVSGGGGITSIVPGTNITVDNTDPANPIVSSTGGAGLDSVKLNWSGTLFNTPTNSTTASKTALLSPTLASQAAWNVFGNHTNATALPTFGKLNINSINATGTPSGTNFLSGDGSWVDGVLSPWVKSGSDIQYSSGRVNVGIFTPSSGTYSIGAIGEVKALGGFNLNSPANTGNLKSGLFTASSKPTIYANNSPTAYFGTVNGTYSGDAVLISATPTGISGSSAKSNWINILQNLSLNVNSTQDFTGLSISGTLNQNAFSTGIVRGIYINHNINVSNYMAIEVAYGNSYFGTSSGSTGIGATNTIDASSILQVTSTTKGVLLPRLTTTQINAIASPANGLTVYNTTESTLCFYNGTSWQKVTSTSL